MSARKPLPPGLADAVANSKRLVSELLALQHDCAIAFAAPTETNVSLVRSRAFIVREQIWALDRLASEFSDAIKEAQDTRDRASSHRGPLLALNGGRG